jgi:hypothetical protein
MNAEIRALIHSARLSLFPKSAGGTTATIGALFEV